MHVYEQESAMSPTRIRRTSASTSRSRRTSLSPYFMEDTALTLAEIRRARALETPAVER
ncbi:MAG TPA: hypothetical protein VMF35_16065 [Acidimicrobiales bacterium]|nr:hypothetical protein [Acidimicrobiales bacterium]